MKKGKSHVKYTTTSSGIARFNGHSIVTVGNIFYGPTKGLVEVNDIISFSAVHLGIGKRGRLYAFLAHTKLQLHFLINVTSELLRDSRHWRKRRASRRQ